MTSPAARRQRGVPPPTVVIACIVNPADAEQAQRRNAAITLLIEIGRRSMLSTLQPTTHR